EECSLERGRAFSCLNTAGHRIDEKSSSRRSASDSSGGLPPPWAQRKKTPIKEMTAAEGNVTDRPKGTKRKRARRAVAPPDILPGAAQRVVPAACRRLQFKA